MDDPKVIVEINGIQYDTEQVKSFLTFYEQGILRISITVDPAAKKNDDTERLACSEALTQPYAEFGVEHEIEEVHIKKFEISNLRSNIQKTGIKEIKTLRSTQRNIKDVKCIEDAVDELINQENKFVDQGYKFFTEITKPTLVFTAQNSGDFYVHEKIVIIKSKSKKKQ